MHLFFGCGNTLKYILSSQASGWRYNAVSLPESTGRTWKASKWGHVLTWPSGTVRPGDPHMLTDPPFFCSTCVSLALLSLAGAEARPFFRPAASPALLYGPAVMCLPPCLTLVFLLPAFSFHRHFYCVISGVDADVPSPTGNCHCPLKSRQF